MHRVFPRMLAIVGVAMLAVGLAAPAAYAKPVTPSPTPSATSAGAPAETCPANTKIYRYTADMTRGTSGSVKEFDFTQKGRTIRMTYHRPYYVKTLIIDGTAPPAVNDDNFPSGDDIVGTYTSPKDFSVMVFCVVRVNPGVNTTYIVYGNGIYSAIIALLGLAALVAVWVARARHRRAGGH